MLTPRGNKLIAMERFFYDIVEARMRPKLNAKRSP